MKKVPSLSLAAFAATLFVAPFAAHAASPAPTRFDLSTAAVASPTAGLTYADSNASGVSSSNAPDMFAAADATSDERASLSEGFDANQPPPGRRRVYGRPRYADRWHNSDGSNKLAFEAGAGLTVPSGPTARYYTPSWRFSVGAGYNWNRMFGALLQFDYDHFGLTAGNINNMYNQYTTLDPIDDFSGLDANAHDWSFSVNPVVNFGSNRGAGAYIIGGVGYDRKTTNFTVPGTGTYCDYFGFCYQYSANQTFDSYSSGGLGVSGGFGLTYKMSRFSSERLFVEARYKYVFTDRNNTLFYTHNAERSGYFPVTAGIRW